MAEYVQWNFKSYLMLNVIYLSHGVLATDPYHATVNVQRRD